MQEASRGKGRRKIRAEDLGIDLSKIGPSELSELAEALVAEVEKEIGKIVSQKEEFNVEASLETGEDTLNLNLLVEVRGRAPIPPEMMAKIDTAVDKALEVFRDDLRRRYGRDKNS
jgi:hypothetical protein